MKINVDSAYTHMVHCRSREGAYLYIWKPVYRTDPPYTHSVQCGWGAVKPKITQNKRKFLKIGVAMIGHLV